MTIEELVAAVCEDAIRIFDLRLEGKEFDELYKTEEFDRIRKRLWEHSFTYTDEEIMEFILKRYSEQLRTT